MSMQSKNVEFRGIDSAWDTPSFIDPDPKPLPQVDPKTQKYTREIVPGIWVDVYDVLWAWKVDNPALAHLLKKVLQPGARGHKDRMEDLHDILVSAKRALELES